LREGRWLRPVDPWRCGDVEAGSFGSRLEHHPVREVHFEAASAGSRALRRLGFGRLDAVSVSSALRRRQTGGWLCGDSVRRASALSGVARFRPGNRVEPSGEAQQEWQRVMGFWSLAETRRARTSVRRLSRGCGWFRLAVAAAGAGFGQHGARCFGTGEQRFRLVSRASRVVQDGGHFGGRADCDDARGVW
jgi:hypothetical protein